MFGDTPLCLPLELERRIFEMSSYSRNDSKHLFNLLLVARYVHDWIKPILYQTFLQSPKTRVPDIERYPTLDLNKIGKFGRNLLFSEEISHFQVTSLLSIFPNVENLAIWTNRTDLAHFQGCVEFQRLPLRRLSVFVASLTNIRLVGAPFQSLTHLELIRTRKEPWDSWKPLTALPRLTHLLINSVIPEKIAGNLLQLCPHLFCLIQLVSVYVVDKWTEEKRAHLCSNGGDHRFVSLTYTSEFHFIRDWQEGLNGGLDSWARSDCICIARQRKYFMDPASYWIPNDSSWTAGLNNAGWDWYLNL
ncbi:hypothetical protein HYPSUDRAFT_961922 [Hypholoma sublateritium FD-334 SS-4]|uniref:F-box domain-containing protein n=1 Tax=Hypholoma sublateritium (strain FD-334 SS-4) TaxID=945553 RepID=A0A0D2NNL3_HYPSF|nr:hypothetical protein HYPSUDRAFT_961922 [Hypholoma sublateritium FD-334 SS-4]